MNISIITDNLIAALQPSVVFFGCLVFSPLHRTLVFLGKGKYCIFKKCILSLSLKQGECMLANPIIVDKYSQ